MNIDVFNGTEWEEIDVTSSFFYNVNDLEAIKECYVQGNTLRVVFKAFSKGDVFYTKSNGHWSNPYITR